MAVQLLLDLLAADPDEWLVVEAAHSAVYTTAAWHYRLANAAHRGTGDGFGMPVALGCGHEVVGGGSA